MIEREWNVCSSSKKKKVVEMMGFQFSRNLLSIYEYGERGAQQSRK